MGVQFFFYSVKGVRGRGQGKKRGVGGKKNGGKKNNNFVLPILNFFRKGTVGGGRRPPAGPEGPWGPEGPPKPTAGASPTYFLV